jgi:hypothetical protein
MRARCPARQVLSPACPLTSPALFYLRDTRLLGPCTDTKPGVVPMTISSAPLGAMNIPKIGYGVGARTVRVDGIAYGGDEILPHDRTVEGDRHDVCPCAISIERGSCRARVLRRAPYCRTWCGATRTSCAARRASDSDSAGPGVSPPSGTPGPVPCR